ncbi:hypothetical protein KSW92_11070, partial [Prevotella copri]|uniref:hypothetical protein n=1 Tax=Segatella copri TaxID=165179 RepID=UPI001C37EAB7
APCRHHQLGEQQCKTYRAAYGCNDITPHYYNLGGAMKIRSATFFMSRGAERKWQRTVFSLSAMLAE